MFSKFEANPCSVRGEKIMAIPLRDAKRKYGETQEGGAFGNGSKD